MQFDEEDEVEEDSDGNMSQVDGQQAAEQVLDSAQASRARMKIQAGSSTDCGMCGKRFTMTRYTYVHGDN